MQLKCKVYDTFLFQRLNRCKKRCLSSPKRASPTSSSTRTWTLQSSVIAKSLSRWAIFHPPSHRHCRREGMQFSRKLRMRICSLGYLCLHGGPLPRSISSLTFLACALFAPLPLGMRTSLNGASRYVQYLPSKFTFTYESAPGPSGDRGDGDGVRRTPSLAWLHELQQLYRMMAPAGVIIPAPAGGTPGGHLHGCLLSPSGLLT